MKKMAENVDVARYIESMKGKSMISLNGFLYRRQRVAQGKSYWVCSLDQRRGCKARLHVLDGTDPPVILTKVEQHNHLADFGQADSRVAMNKMKKIVVETNRDPTEIYDSVIVEENLGEEALASLGGKNQVIASLKNVRQKRYGMCINGDPEFNIRFVKLIEKYKAIYDYDAQKFLSDGEITEVWRCIAHEIGETVTTCKEKWRNIKTNYSRLIKNNGRPKDSWHYLAEHLRFLAPYIRKYPRISDASPSMVNVEVSFENSDVATEGKPDPFATSASFGEDKNAPISGEHPDLHSPDLPTLVSGFRSRTSVSSVDGVTTAFALPGNSHPATDSDIGDHVTHYLATMSRKRKREEEGEDADVGFLKSLVPDMRKMTDEQKHKFKMGVLSLVNDALYSKDP